MQININPINPRGLYRIDKYSDFVSGEILHHVPVLDTGEIDPVRMSAFVGSTILNLSNGQQANIMFPIPGAVTLAQAIDDWHKCCREQIEQVDSQLTRQKLLNGSGISPSQLKGVK